MCRILPGANQVNLAVFVGAKFRGWRELRLRLRSFAGSRAHHSRARLRLFQFHEMPALQSVLHGAAAAAVALTLAMAIKTGRKCLRDHVRLLCGDFRDERLVALAFFRALPSWRRSALSGAGRG